MFQKVRSFQLNKRTAFLAALYLNIFFIFVQLLIIVYSINMGDSVWEKFLERIAASEYDVRFENLFFEPVVMFLVNLAMLYLFFRIEFWLFLRFSACRRKIWMSLFFMLLSVSVLSTVISQLLAFWFKGELTGYHYSIIQFIKDILLFLSSVFVSAQIDLMIRNQKVIEENKNLIIENFENRYNALKNQMNPHFLFNSLNSLNGLIGYDDERAHEYLEHLSSVFRYTMQERSVVTLSDEMEFTESYICLMKIRHGEALSVSIQMRDNYQEYHIPPLAVQILVENALKHNIVSLRKPLYLLIKMTEEETIVVENNLQARRDATAGSGLGLSNLNERYRLMFGRNINIQANDIVFRVEVPLIKNIGEHRTRSVINENVPSAKNKITV